MRFVTHQRFASLLLAGVLVGACVPAPGARGPLITDANGKTNAPTGSAASSHPGTDTPTAVATPVSSTIAAPSAGTLAAPVTNVVSTSGWLGAGATGSTKGTPPATSLNGSPNWTLWGWSG